MYQFEICIVEGRMTFQGIPVEDIIDTDQHVYCQSDTISREKAVALALKAGMAIREQSRAIPVIQHVD